MADYYQEGYQHVIESVAKTTNLTESQVADVYSELSNFGLIDYDIEKDVFFCLISPDEDEDD